MAKAKVISLGIGKGGSLKTTATCNIAYLLNLYGHKTLVIDCDPQCDSTILYGAKTEDTYTIYDCLIKPDDPTDPNKCIQHTEKGDIIAGDGLISELAEMIILKKLTYLDLKKKVLDKIKGYEYILIDCPPDLTGYINKSILISSDELILPVDGDSFSIKGLSDIIKLTNGIKKSYNPNLKIKGMFLIDFNKRTKTSQNALVNLKAISEMIGTVLYETKIRKCAKGKEAIVMADIACRYDPSCHSSIDFKNLVEEIMNQEGIN